MNCVAELFKAPEFVILKLDETATAPPYPLDTNTNPANPSGSTASINPFVRAVESDALTGEPASVNLCEPSTCKYSTAKPVSSTFLALMIEPEVNPVTFAILIVTSATPIDDEAAGPVLNTKLPLEFLNGCVVVEFAIINCPPTTFTLSFSNTAVLNVPLILAFSNSAVPLPSLDILQPFNPVAKSEVSNVPLDLIIKPVSASAYNPPKPESGIVLICESVISHPPILLPICPNRTISVVPSVSNNFNPCLSLESSDISPSLITSVFPLSLNT